MPILLLQIFPLSPGMATPVNLFMRLFEAIGKTIAQFFISLNRLKPGITSHSFFKKAKRRYCFNHLLYVYG